MYSQSVHSDTATWRQACLRVGLALLLLTVTLPALAGPNTRTLEFIENRNQWPGPFLYRCATGNGEVYLEQNGFSYVIGAADNINYLHPHGHSGAITNKYHAYRVRFVGGNPKPRVNGAKPQQHYYNYFLGKDPAYWQTGIHPNLAVDYTGVYAGIDLHVASENGQIKYDFIVAPGADAEAIQLQFVGTDGLRVKDGKLLIQTSVGTVEELQPYAYQYADGQRVEVPCRYSVKDDVVRYTFPKGYDAARQLVIDPTVIFATFTGSSFDNWGFTATYDNLGNFYAGGLTSHQAGGSGYPTTTGAFQLTYGGGSTTSGNIYPCDMGISKFSASGNVLIYSTYLGGANNDQPHSLVVDAANNLIIAGRTYSNNFPVTGLAFDNTHNGGADLVVTKLNATGTALIGSTYLGGAGDDAVNIDASSGVFGALKHNYGDDARSEVIIDNQNNIYVAACTRSTDFPVTPTAIQSSLLGFQDGVVLKLNSNLQALTWSTYLGGANDDAAYVLALDTTQNNLYVAGGTGSANFPSTPGTFQPLYQGGPADGFIAKFTNSGTFALQKMTFIGRGGYDQCYGIQVDNENNVYVMGQTLGGTFPVSAGVYNNPGSSQFIMELDSNLATNLRSTVYGSGNGTATNISPVAFLVDTCQNVYISGWGGNITTPLPPGTTFVTGMPTTANAMQATTDGNDFYFIVLSKNFQNLLYGSFAGQVGGTCEHVDGGTSRFDKNGIVYQAICGGCGGSSAFPTTPGSWSPTNGSANCNLLALKISFDLGAVNADFTATPTRGCPPHTVTFNNTSGNGTTYTWTFGDGSLPFTGTTPPPHTYSNVGTYIIRLIALNPVVCKTSDTAFITITVDTNRATAGFDVQLVDSCDPYTATFVNTSQYSNTPGAPGFTTFQWFFGDGSSFTGTTPPLHNYPDTGSYTIMLVMTDTTACNSPDTITRDIFFTNKLVEANIAANPACEGQPIVLTNSSVNAATYLWDFGDGQTATDGNPVHSYDTAGTYTVKFFAFNPATCNRVDSVTITVTVNPLPTAAFVYDPIIPVTNKPIQFINQSTGAATYAWGFGDGTGSQDVSPSHFYKRSGIYDVCLIARSTEGCLDTVCKKVEADVRPLVDVPTGFSPNGDGPNDVLYVRGAAIETMNFKVFNRWGELVFETSDMSIGWDGTFKGVQQEMDAYAWDLIATFVDGTTVRKKGNVTLLR